MKKRTINTFDDVYVSLHMDSEDNNINKHSSTIKNILSNEVITNKFEAITPLQGKKKKDKKNDPPPLSEEMKLDLEVLKMRTCFDPKILYSTRDMVDLPSTSFQLGEVVPSGLEYYNRLPKKLRGRRMVDELMANPTFIDSLNKRCLKIKETNPFTDVKYKMSKKVTRTYENWLSMKASQKKRKSMKEQQLANAKYLLFNN